MPSQFSRFMATGALNTLAGYTIIFACQLLTKNPYSANAIGFLLSFGLSYYTQSRYAFRKKLSWQRASLYAGSTFLCFLLNLLTLRVLLHDLNPWLAQFAAITVYVLASYFLLAKIVFRSKSTPQQAPSTTRHSP